MNKLQLLATAALVAISAQGFAQEKTAVRASEIASPAQTKANSNMADAAKAQTVAVENYEAMDRMQRDERMRSTLHTDTRPGTAPANITMAATQPQTAVSYSISK
ncbi:MAG: hypothetical protein H6550_14480 [Chitinophagales bacterium]|nr:hypothetical protein [Chitinophagales bacterium]